MKNSMGWDSVMLTSPWSFRQIQNVYTVSIECKAFVHMLGVPDRREHTLGSAWTHKKSCRRAGYGVRHVIIFQRVLNSGSSCWSLRLEFRQIYSTPLCITRSLVTYFAPGMKSPWRTYLSFTFGGILAVTSAYRFFHLLTVSKLNGWSVHLTCHHICRRVYQGYHLFYYPTPFASNHFYKAYAIVQKHQFDNESVRPVVDYTGRNLFCAPRLRPCHDREQHSVGLWSSFCVTSWQKGRQGAFLLVVTWHRSRLGFNHNFSNYNDSKLSERIADKYCKCRFIGSWLSSGPLCCMRTYASIKVLSGHRHKRNVGYQRGVLSLRH